MDTYGKLDILINNAGVFPTVGYINEYPADALDYLLKNNVQSVFMMTKFAIPYLQKTKGNIVSAGSEAGLEGDAQNAPYAGTKGFIHAFIRSVAVEQAEYGVRANVVCPGAIDTAWTHHQTSPMTSKMEKQFISATPMGRRGTPEEVANVYLFLASDEASYVTGALYSVDGGITISKGPAGLMADSSMKKEPKGELDLEHSREGDTVQRPFDKSGNGFGSRYVEEEEFEPSHSSGAVRNTLVGLSLAAVAAGVALNYFRKASETGKNAPAKVPDSAHSTQSGAMGINSPLNAAQPPEEKTKPAKREVENQSGDSTQPGIDPNKSARKGSTGKEETKTGNDTGFTNEAATGNND